MARRRGGPEAHRWLTLTQMAREIDRTPVQTRKLLFKLRFVGIKTKVGLQPDALLYDAKSMEVVKGMLEQPHRHVSDKPDDWLAIHLRGGKPDEHV